MLGGRSALRPEAHVSSTSSKVGQLAASTIERAMEKEGGWVFWLCDTVCLECLESMSIKLRLATWWSRMERRQYALNTLCVGAQGCVQTMGETSPMLFPVSKRHALACLTPSSLFRVRVHRDRSGGGRRALTRVGVRARTAYYNVQLIHTLECILSHTESPRLVEPSRPRARRCCTRAPE